MKHLQNQLKEMKTENCLFLSHKNSELIHQTNESISINEGKSEFISKAYEQIEYEEDVRTNLEKLLTHINAKSPQEAAQIDEHVKLKNNELSVIACEFILEIASREKWDIARYHDSFYVFNGSFWEKITNDDLKYFLGRGAEKINIEKYLSRHHTFQDNLMKQFFTSAYIPPPKADFNETKINLSNGTYLINKTGHSLKPFDKNDFLTYKLPFELDVNATAPIFQKYLDRVLPDNKMQQVLAEFIGYIFVKNSVLKLEKALILFGSGSNGKSVLFDIVINLLGKDNVCNYSLQNLTDDRSYTRSELGGKLLNYASEISTKLNPTIFKILVSGEPIETRQIYQQPFLMTNYAKFMFNTNVLPKEVEQNDAFYRRFTIIPFDQKISDEEKDPNLANHIIENELSGVFNWAVNGLDRLLKQRKFTECEAIINAVKDFRQNSDSVSLFLEDGNYQPSANDQISLKSLFQLYKTFCSTFGYQFCSLKSFSERIDNLNYKTIRKSQGKVVYIMKSK